ncbi:MAG: hypothetical protein ACJASF_002331 [Vicingaceae bacterium]|jgi:hypothetical protein
MKNGVKIISVFIVILTTLLTQDSGIAAFSENKTSHYHNLTVEQFYTIQHSNNTPKLYYTEAHSSKSLMPFAAVIMELKEEVDDDEVSENKTYLKNTLHYSVLFYLGDKGFFESLTSETFPNYIELLSSIAKEVLYLEFQDFRI